MSNLCVIDEHGFCGRHKVTHAPTLLKYCDGNDQKSINFREMWDKKYGVYNAEGRLVQPPFRLSKAQQLAMLNARQQAAQQVKQQRRCCGGGKPQQPKSRPADNPPTTGPAPGVPPADG